MTHATAEFNLATITDRHIRWSPPLSVTGLQLSKIQCEPHSESSAVVRWGKISLAKYDADGQRSKSHSGWLSTKLVKGVFQTKMGETQNLLVGGCEVTRWFVTEKWWPLPDSNRGPDDYEARRETKIYPSSSRKVTLFSGAECFEVHNRTYTELFCLLMSSYQCKSKQINSLTCPNSELFTNWLLNANSFGDGRGGAKTGNL